MAVSSPPAADASLRDQLSNLRGLLVLSMLMTECDDERQIMRLATTSVPSFGRFRLEGAYLVEGGWSVPDSIGLTLDVRAQVEGQLEAAGRAGGRLDLAEEAWAWAFPLRSLGGFVGYLVVSSPAEPPASEQFLLRVLAQQTGVALANARLHARERATAEELRTANTALEQSVHALERSMGIHERLTRVAVRGEGQQGIARALHELTGYPVAVEDRYGNLRAWAGPNRPEPYPKDAPARREQLLRRAIREGRPIRDGGRLLAFARPRDDVLGVIALIDPSGAAGDHELVALEHGATVLAMELARLRSLAETELRLRRDLVEELLAGTDADSALARAQALDYDLERPHRVLVVEGRGRTRDDDLLFHAVRRAARDAEVGSLLVARKGAVVVLATRDQPWERLRTTILTELGGGRCRIGVGGLCHRPADFPRSYHQAQLALKMQTTARGGDRVTAFDDLGVYRILLEVEDAGAVEQQVRDWLGPLLDYDQRKGSELVATLSQYLECGGSYEATAAALSVHRSTLKYRLQRIRDILGRDLSEPDTHFNLQLATRAWTTLQAMQA